MTYVRLAPEPVRPPPLAARGAVAWVRTNLFSSPASAVTTLALAALALWLLPDLVGWATWRAVWSAPDGALCRETQDGACWAFIGHKMEYLLYGAYPENEHWRVNLFEAMGGVLIAWLLWPGVRGKFWGACLFFAVYPIASFFLLHGAAWLGLPFVDSILWGGVFVTLLVSLVGIVVSLPLGILLALGRRSPRPAVKALSVGYIELVRGVPFITVLFMANNLLPLFVPDDYAPDRFLRPLVGTALFAAAYLAEEVRGGLQALSKGQYEGAAALGLGYWRSTGLIALPQALTMTIPGIVGNFIGLFKDTTLVAIVGMTDFLGALDNAFKDTLWSGPTILSTGYAFAALFFYVCCDAMARYARMMERRLSAGRNR